MSKVITAPFRWLVTDPLNALHNTLKAPDVPKPPPPPAPPLTPTIDDARQRAQMMDDAASRRGRAASILTGAGGDLVTPPTTGTKTLLGS